MQVAEVLKQQKRESVDEYLGFAIYAVAGWYLAIPKGWQGEVLEAADIPLMRRKIWRWWYQMAA